ncbi:MAG: response regulator transcription factor [Ardenticatenia bacterium]|nr:response regulator transcription factor [Ardenticatenia bacterium]
MMFKHKRRPYRFVVVDDSIIFIQGVRSTVRNTPHLELVGWANTPEEAIKKYKQVRPDVVVVDLCLPEHRASQSQLIRHADPRCGLDLIRTLRGQRRNGPRILATSTRVEDGLIVQAMRAGAKGFVDRDIDPDQFLGAITRVAKGDTVFDDRHFHLVKEVEKIDQALTRRERQVLRLLCQGSSNKQIAEHLGISVRTAESYVRSLCDKFGVSKRYEVTTKAWRLGLCLTSSNGKIIWLL